MSKPIFFACLFVLFNASLTRAQNDAPETLQWVKAQGSRIDTILNYVMRGHEHTDVMFKLMDAYLIFDAVTLAGVYCTEARAAAQVGRNLCDVVNYRLEKDMNSTLLRAAQAKAAAQKMNSAASACLLELKPEDKGQESFSVVDVIQHDVYIVTLEINDGVASQDVHLLTQKFENAIRVLHDIQHLASTLNNCNQVQQMAEKAITHCESVISARNMTEVNVAVAKALEEIMAINTAVCTD